MHEAEKRITAFLITVQLKRGKTKIGRMGKWCKRDRRQNADRPSDHSQKSDRIEERRHVEAKRVKEATKKRTINLGDACGIEMDVVF